MRIVLALAATLLVLAGCGSDGDTVATDPAPPTRPTSIPAAPGDVWTYNIATVMDTGSPELCLGPVAESYPPQCGGPELVGWDWAAHEGTYDQEGEVRWGTYALTGTWDGTSFTATDAVPGALYDPARPTPTPTPTPATAYDAAELEQIAAELQDEKWVLGAYGGEGSDGHVLVDVVYDDGTLQDRVDDEYGAGVVLVNPALIDAG
jgi:hypothetical protein